MVTGLHKACEGSISFRVKGENVYLRHSYGVLVTTSYPSQDLSLLEKDASFLQLSSLSGGL